MPTSQIPHSGHERGDSPSRDLFAAQLREKMNFRFNVRSSNSTNRSESNLNTDEDLSQNHLGSTAVPGVNSSAGALPLIPEDENPVFPEFLSQDSSLDRLNMNLAGWGLGLDGG